MDSTGGEGASPPSLPFFSKGIADPFRHRGVAAIARRRMNYTASEAMLAVFLFVAAGACEISGGWLVWKWRREGALWVYLVLGSVVLVAYGLIATFQRQDFGRTYAAYGGFFVLLSLFWGWAVDGDKPDLWDWVGATVAIIGASIIMFVPRSSSL